MRCVIVILLAAAWTTGPVLGQVPEANELEGRPLRYLIGADAAGPGRDEAVTVVSYSATHPACTVALPTATCSTSKIPAVMVLIFKSTLRRSTTRRPTQGPGWEKNLREQFERRRKQGFAHIKLDNADAYTVRDVLGAVELAARYDLQVFAKNPGLLSGARSYVAHRNVRGVIVEQGAGSADDMDRLRRQAGKPTLPVWFVAFGKGRSWAASVASVAKTIAIWA
jgi:hypothetical protein